jgi:uncharacterized protein (TIRG00374 family)
MRARWKMWASYGVSAVALVLVLRTTHFSELGGALRDARLVWLIPTLLTLVAAQLVRALRWSILMKRSPLGVTYHALTIGYMLNILLPFRLGEIARTYVMAQRSTVSMPRALSAIVLERVLDLAAAVLVLAGAMRVVPVPPVLQKAATGALVLVIAIVTVTALTIWQAHRVEALLRKLLSRISAAAAERWTKRFVELCDGFRDLGSASRVIAVIALTAISWALVYVNTWTCMNMFLSPGPDEVLLVLAAMAFGSAIPAAPGGVGVVQAFAETALVVPFHEPKDRALAFVLVSTLGQQLVLVSLGFFSLFRVGMSLGQVQKQAAATPPPSPTE